MRGEVTGPEARPNTGGQAALLRNSRWLGPVCAETHCGQSPARGAGAGADPWGSELHEAQVAKPSTRRYDLSFGKRQRGRGAGEKDGWWGRQGEEGTGESSFVRQQHRPRCQGASQGPRGPSHLAPSQMGPAARSSTSGALGVPAVTEDTETCPVPAWGSCRISANTKEHPDAIGGRWL